jgi:hypothetical protein
MASIKGRIHDSGASKKLLGFFIRKLVKLGYLALGLVVQLRRCRLAV